MRVPRSLFFSFPILGPFHVLFEPYLKTLKPSLLPVRVPRNDPVAFLSLDPFLFPLTLFKNTPPELLLPVRVPRSLFFSLLPFESYSLTCKLDFITCEGPKVLILWLLCPWTPCLLHVHVHCSLIRKK